MDEWREEDAAAKAENRRRAAYQAKLTPSLKKQEKVKQADPKDAATGLGGWDEFGEEGLLR